MWIKMMTGPGEGVSGLCLPGRRRPEELIFLMGLWELRAECPHFFGRATGGQQGRREETAVWCIQRDKQQESIKELAGRQNVTEAKEGLADGRDQADGNGGQLTSDR